MARAINIAAAQAGDVVGQQLQRYFTQSAEDKLL
jgi:hypothetical protein